MKYKSYTIKKVAEDLGEDDARKNFVYYIYDQDGEFVNVALELSSAKDYISSGLNPNYL